MNTAIGDKRKGYTTEEISDTNKSAEGYHVRAGHARGEDKTPDDDRNDNSRDTAREENCCERK